MQKKKLSVEQLLVASCCYTLVNTIPPLLSFICALWSCFPQIIFWGPLGISRDSRQTRCACLIKESDVYKCKHSILFTHCSLYALRCVLSGAHWLGAFLSLVKPSVKTNSIGVERHFIFDAWTCALQKNLISLYTTMGKGVLWITGCFVSSMAVWLCSFKKQERANEIHFL